jgi:hypothetical protein
MVAPKQVLRNCLFGRVFGSWHFMKEKVWNELACEVYWKRIFLRSPMAESSVS